MVNLNEARRNMITQQLQSWNVDCDNVLDLFQELPREHFIPPEHCHLALTDARIPIGHGQTTLMPKEEARILQALALKPSDTVLEIGTGCGFFTACLATSCAHVYSVDCFEAFTQWTHKKLQEHHLNNVTLATLNGAAGWEQYASYDAIVITGSLPKLPATYKNQLRTEGRLFAILGDSPAMKATLLTREAQGWQHQVLFDTDIEPLLEIEQANTFTF